MNVEFQELYRKYLEIYWDGDINNALSLDYRARADHQKSIESDYDNEHWNAFYEFATERSIGFVGKVEKMRYHDELDSWFVSLEEIFIVNEGTNVLKFAFQGKIKYSEGGPIPCQVGGTYSFYGRIYTAYLTWGIGYEGTLSALEYQVHGLDNFAPFLLLEIELENATCSSAGESDYTARSFGLPSGERFHSRRLPPEQRSDSPNSAQKGACFVATAAYGSPLAAEVLLLSRFRDEVLLQNKLGVLFVSFYYQVSPPLASLIARAEILRAATRSLFLAPLLRLLKRK